MLIHGYFLMLMPDYFHTPLSFIYISYLPDAEAVRLRFLY